VVTGVIKFLTVLARLPQGPHWLNYFPSLKFN